MTGRPGRAGERTDRTRRRGGRSASGMALRLVLGAVYAAMAAGQLASLERMPEILSAYDVVHGAAAAVLAAALIAGELVCGVWFLARPRSHALAPVWAYTAVSLVWSALAVQAYVRGLTVANCGCFGAYLTQRLGWPILVQDALTLLYAALLLRGARRAGAAPGPGDVGQTHDDGEARARMR